MDIHCSYDALIATNKIIAHPKNRNNHPEKQIKILSKVLKRVGIRKPLIISNLSRNLVAGHGVLEALSSLKISKVPVVYQNFKDEISEYNFMIADNETQRHSFFDMNGFLEDMDEFELNDFNVEEFGLADTLNFETPDIESSDDEPGEDNGDKGRAETKEITCPKCGTLIEI